MTTLHNIRATSVQPKVYNVFFREDGEPMKDFDNATDIVERFIGHISKGRRGGEVETTFLQLVKRGPG